LRAARGADAAIAGEREIGRGDAQLGDVEIAGAADRRGKALALDPVDAHVAGPGERRRLQARHGDADGEAAMIAGPAARAHADAQLAIGDCDIEPLEQSGIALGPDRRLAADRDHDVGRPGERDPVEAADLEVPAGARTGGLGAGAAGGGIARSRAVFAGAGIAGAGEEGSAEEERNAHRESPYCIR
jgi:hypothetical protein